VINSYRWCFGLALSVCGGAAGTAHATYSIAAVDMSTGQVGGAVTSCVGTLDVAIVFGSAPGKGVIHAQAQLDQRGRAKDRAIQLLTQGVAPSEIVMQLTAASFDPQFQSRQYGVVDLTGRAAGFTGADAQAYKHDQQANTGAFVYSVQGNILTSQRVLDQASRAFEAQGCDLADRLMLALEAGAHNGEGDSRCTDQGIPSDSAFIEVDRMGEPAGSYLKLSVTDTAPQSPLIQLRQQFDTWRKQHPCTMAAGAAGSGGLGAAGGGASAIAGRAAAIGGAGGMAAAGAAGASAGMGGAAVQRSAGSAVTGVVPAASAGSVAAGMSTHAAGRAAVSSGAGASGGTGRTGTPLTAAAGVGSAAGATSVAQSPPIAADSGCGCAVVGGGDQAGHAALVWAALSCLAFARARRRV
jgi:uncharacterized Ntn-hydrolase superfamily protein